MNDIKEVIEAYEDGLITTEEFLNKAITALMKVWDDPAHSQNIAEAIVKGIVKGFKGLR